MNSKIIAALSLLLPAVIFSQETGSKSAEDTVYNSLNKSKLAFQYEAGYNFTGESIIPIVFSLKYHFSDKTALRLSVGVNPHEGGFPHDRGLGIEPVSINNTPPYEDHGRNFENLNFTLLYILYPAPKKEINLFFGLGPRFGFGSQHLRFPPNFQPVPNQNHRENTSWSMGLAGLIGAEWFASRSISFFTEYNIAAGYQETDFWELHPNPTGQPYSLYEENSSMFRVTDLSARIGLSLYFDWPF